MVKRDLRVTLHVAFVSYLDEATEHPNRQLQIYSCQYYTAWL